MLKLRKGNEDSGVTEEIKWTDLNDQLDMELNKIEE